MRMVGPVAIAGLILVTAFSLFAMKGSSKNVGAATTKEKPIAILVMLDRSGSTNDNGMGPAYQSACRKISQHFVKPIVTEQDSTDMEICEFVTQEGILSSFKVNKWEQVRGRLAKMIDAPPYTKDQLSETKFSLLLAGKINAFCREHSGQRNVIILLTDGKPDEKHTLIREAAQKLADSGNSPACVIIGPVEPDLIHRWRENLQESLSPLKNVLIVNGEDRLPDVTTTIAGGRAK
jgi:hypothetical protein